MLEKTFIDKLIFIYKYTCSLCIRHTYKYDQLKCEIKKLGKIVNFNINNIKLKSAADNKCQWNDVYLTCSWLNRCMTRVRFFFKNFSFSFFNRILYYHFTCKYIEEYWKPPTLHFITNSLWSLQQRKSTIDVLLENSKLESVLLIFILIYSVLQGFPFKGYLII